VEEGSSADFAIISSKFEVLFETEVRKDKRIGEKRWEVMDGQTNRRVSGLSFSLLALMDGSNG